MSVPGHRGGGVRPAVLAAAAVLILAPWACKKDPDVLLLTVTSEEEVTGYDITLAERSTGEVRKTLRVPVDSTTQQKFRIDFERPGSYVLLVVGHATGVELAHSEVVRIKGIVQRRVRLTSLQGVDGDGDGFVTEADCATIESRGGKCTLTDCDDGRDDINPATLEICGDGIDQNCDGEDAACRDKDGDGWTEDVDCDDDDPDINPGITEHANNCDGVEEPLCGDGIDQDCDGVDRPCEVDQDCDGFAVHLDCDDTNGEVHPDALEICDDDVDQNCNGLTDEGCVVCDLDGDGYQRDDPQTNCPGQAYVAAGLPTDCNDFDAEIFPGLTDNFLPCAGLEGGAPACGALALCDGKDNDCDGLTDEGCPVPDGRPPECDADGDGFMNNTVPGCDPPPGRVDCDDSNPYIFPGAPDYCGDGVAQNCNADTACTADADGDHYNDSVDCNDHDPDVHPWGLEVCDGEDNDCDGMTDEGNPDSQGNPLPTDIYCNDDNDGICGVPPPTGGTMAGEYCNTVRNTTNPECITPPLIGTGRCICSRLVPPGHRDENDFRVPCPGEDLGAVASPRCFFAPKPNRDGEICGGAVDDDCNADTEDAVSCLNEFGLPDCCEDLPLCADLSNDFEHCGDCYNACNGLVSNQCVGGVCVCGGATQACSPGQECEREATPGDAHCNCQSPTCDGCCQGGVTGQCVFAANQTDSQCGTLANTCEDCLSQALICNPSNGRCECDLTGTCTGCCQNNLCETASTGPAGDTHCGTGGGPCDDCQGDYSLNCDGGGVCRCIVGGHCAGCCDGDDCVELPTDIQCGNNGNPCVNCPTCQVCGGSWTCENAAAGTDPRSQCPTEPASSCGFTGVCDGNGACEYWPAGTTVCQNEICNGKWYYPEDYCTAPNTCTNSGTVDCVEYMCTTGGCRTSCTTSSQCAPGYYCVAPNCVPKKPNGQTCVQPVECQFDNCADGYCCNFPCTAACRACNRPGNLGTCTNHPINTDPESECGPTCRSCNGSGACRNTPLGLDPETECAGSPASTCGLTGNCSGSGSCQYWPVGTVCNGSSCAGSTYYPDDTCTAPNTCTNSGQVDCTPYICNASGCLVACSGQGDCSAGNYYCDLNDNQCKAQKVDGLTCNLPIECINGNCVDGYCCDGPCTGTCRGCDVVGDLGNCIDRPANTDPEGECGGLCRSCNGAGVCWNTTAGLDPENDCTDEGAASCGLNGDCDGTAACEYYPTGMVCIASSCVVDVFYFNDTCTAPDTCTNGGSQDCTPYVCNASGCLAGCSGQLDCTTGYYCETDNTCQSKKIDGTLCGNDYECQSTNCVDGYCCNSLCNLDCEACDVGGSQGTCTPHGDGSDPENDCADQGAASCGFDGWCDGSSACRYYGAGTVCAAQSCTGNTRTNADTCNGTGNCIDNGTTDCTPYVCSGVSCLGSCTQQSDCVATYYCDETGDNTCKLKLPNNDPCNFNYECQSDNCSGGTCQP